MLVNGVLGLWREECLSSLSDESTEFWALFGICLLLCVFVCV